jgi:radical SAM protein with 4Fe4S-binding SPASM domain
MIPKYIKWDITCRCNLRCIHCSVGKEYFNDGIEEISVDQKLMIVDKMADAGVAGISLLGGEPLIMGDDFFYIIQHAISKGLKVSFVTNGILLSSRIIKRVVDSGIDHVTISVDGPDKTCHEFIRGKGTFEKLIRNITELTAQIAEKESPLKVNVNTVLNRINYLDIDKMIDLCVQMGANRWTLLCLGSIGYAGDNFECLAIAPDDELDAVRRVAQRYSFGHHNGLNITLQVYPLVIDYIEMKYNLKLPKSRICCNASINFGFIGPDGNMYPCDRISNEHYIGYDIYGAPITPMSLIDHSFYEIWNSDYYTNMFKFILNNDTYKNYHPCNHCKYLKNGYCNPCPLYSLDSNVDVKICRIVEKELGDISGSEEDMSLLDELLSNKNLLLEKTSKFSAKSEMVHLKVPIKMWGVRSFEKGENLILLSPYDVNYSGLNMSGKLIWDLINGENTVQDISDVIIEMAAEAVKNVSSPIVEDELRKELNEKVLFFIYNLYDLGLISWKSNCVRPTPP